MFIHCSRIKLWIAPSLLSMQLTISWSYPFRFLGSDGSKFITVAWSIYLYPDLSFRQQIGYYFKSSKRSKEKDKRRFSKLLIQRKLQLSTSWPIIYLASELSLHQDDSDWYRIDPFKFRRRSVHRSWNVNFTAIINRTQSYLSQYNRTFDFYSNSNFFNPK